MSGYVTREKNGKQQTVTANEHLRRTELDMMRTIWRSLPWRTRARLWLAGLMNWRRR